MLPGVGAVPGFLLPTFCRRESGGTFILSAVEDAKRTVDEA
uniref:Uncharacterized protein n=1 Tax=Anguilla anguilla TaxID=7936 RepID=A0A0E9ULX7_ANGAN